MEAAKNRRIQKQSSQPAHKKKMNKFTNDNLSCQGKLPSPKLVHKVMEDTDNGNMVKRPKMEPKFDLLHLNSSDENIPNQNPEVNDTDDECQNGGNNNEKNAKHDDDDNAHRGDSDSDDDNRDNDNDDDNDDIKKDHHNTESLSSSSDDEDEEISETDDNADMNEILSFKPGTTAADIFTSVLAWTVGHGISLAPTLSVLKLWNFISTDAQLPTTETNFIEAIGRKDDPPIKCHTYCRKCQTVIDFSTVPIANPTCCGTCGPIEPEQTNPFFVTANIKSQLQTILAIPGIQEQLQYRFNRKKNRDDGIEDIYDGIEYKRHSEPGNFLSFKWNYSFTIHIDSCRIARSSSKAWPVLLTLNELPPELRKRHVVLAGIWVSETPVKLETYLVPIFDDLWLLHSSGITWKPDDSNVMTSKFIPLICLVGAELRPDLLNMHKPNEPFGCPSCYVDGKQLNNERVYPVEEKQKYRSDKELRQHMADAASSGEPVMGAKGDSIATRIPGFDLVSGTVVDSSDVIFMGAAKELVQMFISSPTTSRWYRGDRKSLKKINEVNLCPTDSIGREQKLIESYKSWDATDWKHWLLYYSVPSMLSVVRRTDHDLLVTLSDAAHLISGNMLTLDELKTARELIQKFIYGFQSTFGVAKMSQKIHLLNHLADTVENWGPLWVHSSYPFKYCNQESIKLVSSRKANALQLCRGYFLRTFVENIYNNSTVSDTIKSQALTTLNSGKEGSPEFYLRKGDYRYFHGIGSAKQSKRNPLAWQNKLLKDLGIKNASKFTLYNQALIKGIKYSCKGYSPDINDSFDENAKCEYPTMLYTKNNDLGEIISIVSFIDVEGTTMNGVFIQFMDDAEKRFNTAHIRQLKETPDKGFILADDVLAPAIILSPLYADTRYVARLAIPWE
ncbi:uncharacterized protein [Venturia canescens]|uniref:uncharacterized protein n=1 Tax=Venturia canescens TaxID=32260 RepID=UPI001C9CE27C|nr:uncharacterized protein LOC122410695 [Venturia canescens]XP_043274990.1 uncharacterized protein LOC122410695 [Venturia canescens]XP_043274991.1 uncharacterized protein LOC122410695 [Venturia canescens]